MRAVRAVIHGNVQGVGFRAFVTRNARELGLGGWVRNRRDGTVETMFEGANDAVVDMIERCRRGPRFATVTEVITEETPSTGAAAFDVAPTI